MRKLFAWPADKLKRAPLFLTVQRRRNLTEDAHHWSALLLALTNDLSSFRII